jgi:hypothetical protein
MDPARSVRRALYEEEFLFPFAFGLDIRIDLVVFPELYHSFFYLFIIV